MLKTYIKLTILSFLFIIACDQKNDNTDAPVSVNINSATDYNFRYEDYEVNYSINGQGNYQYLLKFVLSDSLGLVRYESNFFDTVCFSSHISFNQSLWKVSWFDDFNPIDFYNLENNNFLIQLYLVDSNTGKVLIKSNTIRAKLNRENPDSSLLENFILFDTKRERHELIRILKEKDFVLLFHFVMWCGWSKISIPAINYIDSVYNMEISTFGIEGSATNESHINGLNSFISNHNIKYPVCPIFENLRLDEVLKLNEKGFPNFLLINHERRLIYQQTGYSDNLIDSVDFYIKGNLK